MLKITAIATATEKSLRHVKQLGQRGRYSETEEKETRKKKKVTLIDNC